MTIKVIKQANQGCRLSITVIVDDVEFIVREKGHTYDGCYLLKAVTGTSAQNYQGFFGDAEIILEKEDTAQVTVRQIPLYVLSLDAFQIMTEIVEKAREIRDLFASSYPAFYAEAMMEYED